MNISKMRVLLALAVAVGVVGAFAPSASAWHFNPSGTSECVQRVDDLCKTRISIVAVGFTSPASIPVGITSAGVNVFSEDATGMTQTGEADYGQPTTFVNGTNTFEVWLPCDVVKFYGIKHKDQSSVTKVAINHDVPACQPPPPPTPPTGPPVQGGGTPVPIPKPSVNKFAVAVTKRCVKPNGKVGYKVYKTSNVAKVTWYIGGKKYKTTTSNHYIRVKARRVLVEVTFLDGTKRPITLVHKATCSYDKPRYTG